MGESAGPHSLCSLCPFVSAGFFDNNQVTNEWREWKYCQCIYVATDDYSNSRTYRLKHTSRHLEFNARRS